MSVGNRRDRQNGMLVTHYRLGDPAHCFRDRIICRTLGVDNALRGITHIFKQAGEIRGIAIVAALPAEKRQINTGNIGAAEYSHLAVAVLTDYKRVNVPAVDPETFSDELLQCQVPSRNL